MLAFEYCECGCKGSESVTIGTTSWWYYIVLSERDFSVTKVLLHRGHGFISPLIKECYSVEEAVKIASEEARIVLDKEMQKLLNIQKQLNATPPKPPKALTFEQELRVLFPGPDNKGVRNLLRECNNSRQILLMSKSVAFTELGKQNLKKLAIAFDRKK